MRFVWQEIYHGRRGAEIVDGDAAGNGSGRPEGKPAATGFPVGLLSQRIAESESTSPPKSSH